MVPVPLRDLCKSHSKLLANCYFCRVIPEWLCVEVFQERIQLRLVFLFPSHSETSIDASIFSLNVLKVGLLDPGASHVDVEFGLSPRGHLHLEGGHIVPESLLVPTFVGDGTLECGRHPRVFFQYFTFFVEVLLIAALVDILFEQFDLTCNSVDACDFPNQFESTLIIGVLAEIALAFIELERDLHWYGLEASRTNVCSTSDGCSLNCSVLFALFIFRSRLQIGVVLI